MLGQLNVKKLLEQPCFSFKHLLLALSYSSDVGAVNSYRYEAETSLECELSVTRLIRYNPKAKRRSIHYVTLGQRGLLDL